LVRGDRVCKIGHCDFGQSFLCDWGADILFSAQGNIFPTGKVLESQHSNKLYEAIFWISLSL